MIRKVKRFMKAFKTDDWVDNQINTWIDKTGYQLISASYVSPSAGVEVAFIVYEENENE